MAECKGCIHYKNFCSPYTLPNESFPEVDGCKVFTPKIEDICEQIIRKKAEVSDYWQNDVKQYRAMQGYSDIEHDVDNFLRGYNEAFEDMIAILYGKQKEV